MKKQQSLRVVLKAVIAYCLLATNPIVWAQDEKAIELEEQGRGALNSGRYEEAVELFSAGSSQATDSDLKARLNFRQAVARQQLSVQESNPETRITLLRSAARLYKEYLEANPDSSAAANNLAKLYKQMGIEAQESGRANRAPRYFERSALLFEKAIAAADSRQGLYLKNYAQLLEHTGEWEKAKSVYTQIIKEQPMSSEFQQSIADSYIKHGLDQLSQYLWELLDAGYVQQVAEGGLDALENSAGKSDSGRVELLTIVCAALAKGTYGSESFPHSPKGIRLASLANDSYLGDGAAEINRLHKGLPLNDSDYRWWRNQGRRNDDRSLGLWPTQGFQALIRSLGSRAKTSGAIELADGYFRLSATLLPWEIDPAAVRGLVLMYAEENRYDKINEALEDYQLDLFTSKGAAIAGARDGKIFEYHQTLGELYALIGRWGSSSRPDSAIYQLEHARQKSQVLDNSSNKALQTKYQFTPQMVDMLATGYTQIGETEKNTKLRIEQAESYKRAGDIKATKRVLSPLQKSRVPSTLENRYKSLIATPAIKPPESRKLQLKEKDGAT
jgi:tetratricopeptide (TPR) repeat protein